MSFVEIAEGASPVVLGFPHTGTFVPESLKKRLNNRGLGLSDTDWHVHALYADLLAGASTVRTRIHRYVIDANRDPDGLSLYPGQNTTGLCPTTDFDGHSIYRMGQEPDADEIRERCNKLHLPYHTALSNELDRVRHQFGFAILFDCHSIRSRIPFLFDGTLPDLCIGTSDGSSCDPAIEALTVTVCREAVTHTFVLNGRFKGGWTTRHYGRPTDGIHAIQMELSQSTYMLESPPWSYRQQDAERVRVHLKRILADLSNWRP